MKDKRRSLKTKFWDDTFVGDLSPNHKLLYLYLLTNPLTNLIGIYEISKRRIKFDTGLNEETIAKGFEALSNGSKAFLLNDNFVILPNWMKNQDFNTNMRKAAKRELSDLPKELKNKVLGNGSEGLLNDSEWLPNGSLTFENIEIEEEGEIEEEKESKKDVYRSFAHLKISNKEFDKLISSGYSKQQIDNILDNIENFKQNKKYNSLYLTANTWLKRDGKRVDQNKSGQPIVY